MPLVESKLYLAMTGMTATLILFITVNWTYYNVVRVIASGTGFTGEVEITVSIEIVSEGASCTMQFSFRRGHVKSVS